MTRNNPDQNGVTPGMTRDMNGLRLVPGVNADKVDVARGMLMAVQFDYASPGHQMTVEYALMRHARGEEDGAWRTARSGGIDLTSWYAILAAAIVTTS